MRRRLGGHRLRLLNVDDRWRWGLGGRYGDEDQDDSDHQQDDADQGEQCSDSGIGVVDAKPEETHATVLRSRNPTDEEYNSENQQDESKVPVRVGRTGRLLDESWITHLLRGRIQDT